MIHCSFQNPEDRTATRSKKSMSLLSFLTRLIWLCMVPLLIVAVYLAFRHVSTLTAERKQAGKHRVRNIASSIDYQITAQISALRLLAASPLMDEPLNLKQAYDGAQAFRQYFGGHVILADLSTQMLFHTREPFGAPLPKLPRPKGHAAAPAVLETGQPAVGDMFFGSLAREPLVAIVVPVVRNGHMKFLLLSIIETRQFQQRLDEVSLPPGWSLTVLDGKGAVMARRSPLEKDGSEDEEAYSGRFVAKSTVSHWSVVLTIPEGVYLAPIISSAVTLAAAILAATLVGLLGGRLAGGRLATSVAGIAHNRSQEASGWVISEIEAVRKMLVDAETARDASESASLETARHLELAVDAGNVGLWDWNLETNSVFYSRKWKQQIGYEDHEICDALDEWESRLHPDDLDAATDKVRDYLETPWPDYVNEFRFRHKDGSYRWIRAQASLMRNEDGKLVHMLGCHLDVTEQKISEQSLRESEERYRSLFENMREGYAYCRMLFENDKPDDFVYLAVNNAFATLTGLTDVTGKKVTEVIPGIRESNPDLFDLYGRVALTGEPKKFETYLPSLGIWFSISVYSMQREHFIAVFENITNRKQAEAQLAESEQRFRLAFENANIGVCLVDTEGRLMKVNDQMCKIFGYDRSELEGMKVSDVTLPDDVDISRRFMTLARSGEVDRGAFEKRYIHKQGHILWGKVSSTLVRDQQCNPLYFISHVQDITDRKMAEEALKDSEERYRHLVEMSPDGIAVHQNGTIVFVNPAGAKMIGAESSEQIIGRSIREIVHPDYQEQAGRRIQRMLEGETGLYPVEDCYVKMDGTAFFVEVVASRFTYEGKPSIQVVVRDITERKRAEQTERLLATAIDQATEGFIVTDTEGNIQYVNPGMERITGYSGEELIGRTPRVLKSGQHDTSFYRKLWDTIKAGRTWTGRFINRRKDGRLYHEEATISPVRDAQDNVINFVAVKRDITEHLELSRQLYQAQKMEAIGTLAGGVAHDFNNILQVALGYSELMIDDEKLPQRYRADLKKIKESSKRGADLVRRLLTFSRKTEFNPSPLNLNRRIIEIRKMLERTIPKMVDIELLLDEDLATILADSTQIDQVLMNLSVNARDAMPEGGKLVFETANVMLDEEYARIRLDAKPGPHVLLMVSDTGAGMDKETLEHIFEPFYTTKGVGEGTGLGLAMVHGIVKQHRGHIRCYSEPGHGTTFRLYFPAEISPEDEDQIAVRAMPQGGSETILIVEDEEPVRSLASIILTKAGYSVILACDGKEALEIYQDRRDEIDLVILDLIMPEMGGKQCLQALLKTYPSVKVVIASGHSANGLTRGALSAGAKGFIDKPYDIRKVLGVVREVLDRNEAS